MKKMIELIKTFPYGNAKALISSCSKENKTAYALYKSLGFVDIGDIDKDGDQICRLNLK